MQALTSGPLLDIWERGQGRGTVERALLLLASASPDLDADGCADLSIGERNAAILRLRRSMFGTQLPGAVHCPNCRQQLEFQVDVDDLLSAAAAAPECELTIRKGLRFRLPTSRDLLAVAQCDDADAAARRLLRLCCIEAPDGQQWSQALLAETETRMAAADGVADVELQLDCAACGHAWVDYLDIIRFFWEELDRHVQHVLDDVHRLASVYGWDEQQILAMSSARRAAYLERCDA
jgi:hypothetical protein